MTNNCKIEKLLQIRFIVRSSFIEMNTMDKKNINRRLKSTHKHTHENIYQIK